MNVNKVITKTKSNKAPGKGRVPFEFYKYAPAEFLLKFLNVFNVIYESGFIPRSFGYAIVFPIYKKGERRKEKGVEL